MYLLEIQSSTCQSFKSLQHEKSKSEKTVYKNIYACDVTSCLINLSLFPFAAVASRATFWSSHFNVLGLFAAIGYF